MENSGSSNHKITNNLGFWIAIGLMAGTGIGVAIDNLAMGMGIGMLIGVVIGIIPKPEAKE